jgi:hypothetical protein
MYHATRYFAPRYFAPRYFAGCVIVAPEVGGYLILKTTADGKYLVLSVAV